MRWRWTVTAMLAAFPLVDHWADADSVRQRGSGSVSVVEDVPELCLIDGIQRGDHSADPRREPADQPHRRGW